MPPESRYDRLRRRENEIRRAVGNLETLRLDGFKTPIEAVKVRRDFVYRSTPAPSPASDRKLPYDRTDQPPSTRLTTSVGSSLRLELVALFEAQTRTRAGAAPTNERPLDGSGQSEVGWMDLLALDAKPRGKSDRKRSYLDEVALRRKQLNRNLARLHEEELVSFPNGAKKRGANENFLLMHEGGKRKAGPNAEYRVPRFDEDYFQIPVSFFTQGWIYVLEDSEIAFLLMAASFYDPKKPETEQRLSGETRIRHYGINPNTFEKNEILGALGLVHVTPDPLRSPFGTVEGYEAGGDRMPLPHAFRFLPEGLELDAHKSVLSYFE